MPRKRTLTRGQAERRQAKAVQFVTDVVGRPDLADEIASLSVDEYAERKGLQLSNPSGKGVVQLKQQEFLQQVKDTVVEAVKEARSNPTLAQPVSAALSVPAAPVTPARKQTERLARRERDKILAGIDDALTAVDEGREDEGYDLLNDLLEKYSSEDEEE